MTKPAPMEPQPVPMVPEDGKRDLGEFIIKVATTDGELARLKGLPIEKLKDELAANGVDRDSLPDTVHIEQNTDDEVWLIVPNGKMVQQNLDNMGTSEQYTHPKGYSEDVGNSERAYNYRVGDYVLAQCG